ncbi:MAG TPA: substrate binding domain-containing protein, partial [Burkholderiaceae bacterium]|nr:substrate binding domain-containing protein [Burkholderiaceae bacterium]
DFLREYPEVRLELDMSDRLSSMATEGFDLAIRHTAAAPDTHVAWTLCATRSVLAASRSYLRRNGTPTTPEDLVAHNCLHYPRAHDLPVWTFERSPRTTSQVTVPVSGSFSANNSEALRDAALTGLGIALLPDFTAQTSLRTGKLVQVLPQWKPVGAFADQLYAIRPYSPHVPRAVTAFVTYLRQTLAAGFGEDISRG